eukprot:gene520-1169_t
MVSCFPQVWAPKELSYFTATCSVVLCIVIFFGNLAIIVAVLVDPLRKLRTPFSYFLVNLAVSDFVVGAIAMPSSFFAHLHEAGGHVPDYLVTLIHVTYFVSTTASVLSLAALSLDRFLAIRWPIRYRRSLRMHRCVVMSIAIWVFSGSVSMLYFTVGYIDYLMVFVHVSIVIAFFILVMTYRQVYKTLRSQSQELRVLDSSAAEQRNNEEQIRRLRTEKKVTRAFLMILGLFLSCYAPAIIMIYVLQFCDQCSCDLRHVLRDLQFVFVSANSAMNPFVCAIRLGPFRRSILAILSCKRKKSKYEMTASSNQLHNMPRKRTFISSDNDACERENHISNNASTVK